MLDTLAGRVPLPPELVRSHLFSDFLATIFRRHPRPALSALLPLLTPSDASVALEFLTPETRNALREALMNESDDDDEDDEEESSDGDKGDDDDAGGDFGIFT